MIISHSEIQQDTLQIRNEIPADSIVSKSDSVSTVLISEPDSILNLNPPQNPLPVDKPVQKEVKEVSYDTTSVCYRNSIPDFTFYNSDNVFFLTGQENINNFPFTFIEKSSQIKIALRKSLIKHLKHGEEIPAEPLHNDWIIGIVMIAALLYSLIRTASKDVLPGAPGFFLRIFINEQYSRNIEGVFNWQSTIQNLFSFLIIGLFATSAATYYNIDFFDMNGLVLFVILLLIIIAAVTLRHFICVLTGIVSGEEEVFKEYLLTIYQSYRIIALILFVLVILISYTVILPVKIIIISGAILSGLIYLVRLFRLIVIFISNNISIFYLILYLCALEILPVLISLKYFAGLI